MAEPTHIIDGEDTLNIEQSVRVPDIDDTIYLLEVADTPLTAFLTQIKRAEQGGSFKAAGLQTEVTYNPEFTEFEDKYSGIWDTIDHGAGYSAGDTDIKLAIATIVNKYDLIKIVRTGEVLRVTAINYSTKVATVTRSIGATAAAAINDDDDVLVISSAFEEGAGKAVSNVTKLTKVINYTQIFKTSFEVTNTLDASKTYPTGAVGAEKNRLRRKAGVEHAKKIEAAYWFGEKSEGTGPDGKPLRTTGGILEAIVAAGNVQDQGDTVLTLTDFNDFLAMGFKYGSTEKTLFCGSVVLSAIEGFASDKIRLKQGDTSFGVAIRQYISAYGIVNIVKHPMFDGPYNNRAVLLDLTTVKHRPLNGRDTYLETSIQEKGADTQIDQYLTECGLGRANFECNAMLINVGDGES